MPESCGILLDAFPVGGGGSPLAPPAFGSIGTLLGAATSTPSVAVPAGVANGHFIMVAAYLDGNTTSVTGMPAGFQAAELIPVSANPGGLDPWKLFVAYKFATGADSGTYAFTLNTSVFVYAQALRYTNVANPTAWDLGAGAAQSGASNVNATPAVSTASLDANRLFIHIAGNWNGDGGAWTAPSGYTLRTSGSSGVTNIAVSDKVQAVAGSSGSVSGNCTGSGKQAAWIAPLIGV